MTVQWFFVTCRFDAKLTSTFVVCTNRDSDLPRHCASLQCEFPKSVYPSLCNNLATSPFLSLYFLSKVQHDRLHACKAQFLPNQERITSRCYRRFNLRWCCTIASAGHHHCCVGYWCRWRRLDLFATHCPAIHWVILHPCTSMIIAALIDIPTCERIRLLFTSRVLATQMIKSLCRLLGHTRLRGYCARKFSNEVLPLREVFRAWVLRNLNLSRIAWRTDSMFLNHTQPLGLHQRCRHNHGYETSRSNNLSAGRIIMYLSNHRLSFLLSRFT